MSVFIIAEAGVNHNGSIDLAKKLIDVASAAEANAVKFQTFKAKNLATKNLEKANYQKKTTDQKETQFNMLKKLELSKEMHFELINYSKKKNIDQIILSLYQTLNCNCKISNTNKMYFNSFVSFLFTLFLFFLFFKIHFLLLFSFQICLILDGY